MFRTDSVVTFPIIHYGFINESSRGTFNLISPITLLSKYLSQNKPWCQVIWNNLESIKWLTKSFGAVTELISDSLTEPQVTSDSKRTNSCCCVISDWLFILKRTVKKISLVINLFTITFFMITMCSYKPKFAKQFKEEAFY